MRRSDSSDDTRTAEHRAADPGPGTYALIREHNGPCSLVGERACLDAAIDAARRMDTRQGPTELEFELHVDAMVAGIDEATAYLIGQAEAQGWRVVASAPADEHWTVLAAA